MTRASQAKRMGWLLAGGLGALIGAIAPGHVAAQGNAPMQTYWYDGGTRREVWIDPADQTVRPPPPSVRGKTSNGVATSDAVPAKGGAPGNPVVLPGPVGPASSVQATQRRAAQPGDAGAGPVTSVAAPVTTLASGVVVTLRQPLPDAQARALLRSQGLTAQREIGALSGVWLVEAPAGIEALQLANRVHESGVFASAQPNWQRPLLTK